MKNLNEDHIQKIDQWLGQHNTLNPSETIKDEERVFKFFDTIIKSEIQFNHRGGKPTIKDGVKTAYALLKAAGNLSPYYKKKYEHLLRPLTEEITFDIQDVESRQATDSSIAQGQVLEMTLLINEWQKLTYAEPTSNPDGAFNSFIKLLYQLRDPEYAQENHERLINHAIDMKCRMESGLHSKDAE
jgi:hypothetical protein